MRARHDAFDIHRFPRRVYVAAEVDAAGERGVDRIVREDVGAGALQKRSGGKKGRLV